MTGVADPVDASVEGVDLSTGTRERRVTIVRRMGTGHLQRIVFDAKMEEIRGESMLTNCASEFARCSRGPMVCCSC